MSPRGRKGMEDGKVGQGVGNKIVLGQWVGQLTAHWWKVEHGKVGQRASIVIGWRERQLTAHW